MYETFEGSKTIPGIAEEEGVDIIDVDPERAKACVVHGQDLKVFRDGCLTIGEWTRRQGITGHMRDDLFKNKTSRYEVTVE